MFQSKSSFSWCQLYHVYHLSAPTFRSTESQSRKVIHTETASTQYQCIITPHWRNYPPGWFHIDIKNNLKRKTSAKCSPLNWLLRLFVIQLNLLTSQHLEMCLSFFLELIIHNIWHYLSQLLHLHSGELQQERSWHAQKMVCSAILKLHFTPKARWDQPHACGLFSQWNNRLSLAFRSD